MKRRKFLKTGLVSAGSMLPFSLEPMLISGQAAQFGHSRVVIAHNPKLLQKFTSPDSLQLQKLLDEAVCNLADRNTPIEAWQRFVKRGEVIGLKVNCLSGRGSTHLELVEAISERLQQAGIKATDIVIWDRFNSDLEDAGFQINIKGRDKRCFGNDVLGFEPELSVFGSVGSLVCKTVTRVCDGVINLPVLKDHGIAGVTISLKNLFGAIHNPNKYHLDVGNPYIPDVFKLPPIHHKVRLTICDAIQAQYEGGPSYMPQWSWNCNSLITATDPVALDYTGWQIIEAKRQEMNLNSLKEVGREPLYISTAADINHQLGTNDPRKIDIIKVD
jgi:uncharacterized protein (DUF362 family)